MSAPILEATFAVALERAHALAPLSPMELLPLSQCGGRVIAHDIAAQSDMPPFAASRVDGWAIAGDGPWQIVGEVTAGHRFDGSLAAGECVHIATGTEMPAGSTAALRDEHSQAVNGYVSISDHLNPSEQSVTDGTDVRPIGIEAREGDVLISSGTTLTPGLIGLCAAAGYAAVGVRKQLHVTVFVLGDELIHEGTSGEGKVRDALGPQIPLWIEKLGAICDDVIFVPDTREALNLALRSATSELIITTGSTAAGPEDHLHSAIKELGGEIDVDAVLMRPGYHTLFGSIGTQTILGLPGNPQSAVIGLLTFGRAIIDGAYGNRSSSFAERRTAVAYSASVNEVRIALSSQSADGVSPVEHVDSSMLRGFANADGFAVIPGGGCEIGQNVDWIPLPN